MSLEKIEIKEESPIDVKRFYLPIKIKIKCPHCGKEISRDLRENYLSYPIINNIENLCFYCADGCEKESEVDIKLSISIEVDTDKVRKI